MSRRARELAILDLVVAEVVSNQADLVKLLHARGFEVTQATVSRDIKRLGLGKRPSHRGGYRYAAPGNASMSQQRLETQLRRACEQYLTKIDTGDSLLVLKTLSGRANAVAVALDECGLSEIVATLAGDDTILIVARDRHDRAQLLERFGEMLS